MSSFGTACPSYSLTAVTNTMTKGPVGRKGFISSYNSHTPLLEKLGREAGGRTEAKTMEERCLLACCPLFAQAALFYPQDHLPGWCAPPTARYLRPHQSLITKMPTVLSTGSLMETLH